MEYSIQNVITLLRTEKNITQEELACAVEVSRQTINALEKGNYTPSLLLAMRISEFFGKRVDEVFTLHEVN